MAWLIGAALVVMVSAASLGGAHAGPHGLFGPVAALGLAVGWFVAAAAEGATSGTAWWLAGTCAAACVVSASLALPALRYRRMGPTLAGPAAPGEAGRAVTALDPVGVVQLHGESWTAESVSGAVPAGAEVRVVSVDGVRLRVWSEEGVPC
jgi:membrane protein implicated in regulation of membrane protease activity